jgi:hypothetical protein
VEAVIGLVRDSAPGAEAVDDPRFDSAEDADELEHRGHVAVGGVAAEEGGVRLGQAVAPGGTVQLDDAAARHRAQPFAHVALGEAGSGGKLGAGRRSGLDRLEQAGAMSDRDHHAERGVVGHRDQAVRELLLGRGEIRLRGLELGQQPAIVAHFYSPSCWVQIEKSWRSRTSCMASSTLVRTAYLFMSSLLWLRVGEQWRSA